MPLKIKAVGGKYQVKNTSNGLVHAKGTTLVKAKKQVRMFGLMASRAKDAASVSNTVFKGSPKYGSGMQ